MIVVRDAYTLVIHEHQIAVRVVQFIHRKYVITTQVIVTEKEANQWQVAASCTVS